MEEQQAILGGILDLKSKDWSGSLGFTTYMLCDLGQGRKF